VEFEIFVTEICQCFFIYFFPINSEEFVDYLFNFKILQRFAIVRFIEMSAPDMEKLNAQNLILYSDNDSSTL